VNYRTEIGVVKLPPFREIDPPTALCFYIEFGVWGWPKTPCSPPAVRRDPSCPLPTERAITAALHRFPNHGNKYARDKSKFFDSDGKIVTRAQAPTWQDLRLFGSAAAFLLDNADLALWATCLVGNWSSEMRNLSLKEDVRDALNGTFPIHVTFVDKPKGNPNATAWAFTKREDEDTSSDSTQGWIIPIGVQSWLDRLEPFLAGTEASGVMAEYSRVRDIAFCEVAQFAGVLLHELIHIMADHWTHEDANYTSAYPSIYAGLDEVGARHEDAIPEPCWDEARMVVTIWQYALSQRYPCITVGNCEDYDDAWRVAHSRRGV